MFLIQNYAVCLLKNVLQLRQFESDFRLPLLPVDKIIDHSALDRARTVQRIQRRQIFNPCRLVTPQNIAHAVRLKLENRRRIAPREKFVRRFVVQCQIFQIHVDAAVLLDHQNGILQHGQRRQPKEIHFEQTDSLQRVHVVLRRDFVAVRLVNRHQIRQRGGGNHHACRVR